jgi:hypothetical protein
MSEETAARALTIARRAIDRKLKAVEVLPEMEAGAILSLPGVNGLDSEESSDADRTGY